MFLGVFSCSTPVFAQSVTDAVEHYEFVQNAINNPAVAEDTTPEAEILYEVEEKRDEYTKVYKKDDGTYTAVMSAEPLHYLSDGEWEEINNSLILDGDFYSNTNNLFNVELPESISSNENLTVEKDGYEISFSVEDISESTAVVENNVVAGETSVSTADEAIAQTQSSVTYSGVAENTDLQYIVTPNSIKENIIVSDKESVKETYTYDEDGYLSSKLIETKQPEATDDSFTKSERYDYSWAYGKLINQVHTDYSYTIPLQTVIKLVYDSYNSVQGFIVNDTASYIFLKNLYGDIVDVVSESGDEVATYSYDVWGKQTVTSTEDIVKLLPLAYRGYFFDNDTNLYFIDKRAYNPNLGKFLDSASAEAEGLPEIAEYNMYTYWENNPVWYMTKEEKEAYEANSVANYWHNKKVTVENFAKLKKQQGVEDDNQVNTFIYDQTLDEINQYRCGVVTSRPKGCGWIATYNASKLLGYNLRPEEIIKEYEEMGIFMQGFFGVHPFAVAKFFTDRGHDINVHFGDFVDLDNLNSLSEVNVMFYDGKPTGHYAAIQYKNNVFEGYNVFGSTAVEPLGNSIYDPGKAEDNTLGVYTGKVLISISPKE